LLARARKSSRFSGRGPQADLLQLSRQIIFVVVLLGEFIVDLQVLGLHVESSQFRVLTEVDRRGCPSLSGALVLAEEEGYGRDSGRTMFQCFTDGFAQLSGPVGVQQFQKLCGLAVGRFPAGESRLEQGPAFRHRLFQASTRSRAAGLALFLQQFLLVSRVQHQLTPVVETMVASQFFRPIQDTDL